MKLVHVVGARPNFMKAAPVLRAVRRGQDWRQSLVHTGQHYDDTMSKVFFEELDLPEPDVNLEAGSGSHAYQTAHIMLRFEPLVTETRPDWVLVYGDVNSTVACALVAAKLGVRVAHVEAGLRSWDRTMPEELNRILTDALGDLLLTPSADADENLKRENVPTERIARVGNVMIDTLLACLDRARARRSHERLDVPPHGFVYVTLHRPSNVDDPAVLETIMDRLSALAERWPVVLPVHPRTRDRLAQAGLLERLERHPRMRLTEPLGYLDSMCLTDQAGCVVTDSGGLQEETSVLRVPCLTLRPNTERPITITHGTNRLTRPDTMEADVIAAFARREGFAALPPLPLWDGHAAERIVAALAARG